MCPKNICSLFIKLFYFILEVASIDHETYFSIPVIITISVSRKKIYTNVINNWGIIYKYIVFGRGICGKYKSRDEKLPKPNVEGNLVSRLVFFANTPPKHDISAWLYRILFKTLAKSIIPFVCHFQDLTWCICLILPNDVT